MAEELYVSGEPLVVVFGVEEGYSDEAVVRAVEARVKATKRRNPVDRRLRPGRWVAEKTVKPGSVARTVLKWYREEGHKLHPEVREQEAVAYVRSVGFGFPIPWFTVAKIVIQLVMLLVRYLNSRESEGFRRAALGGR